MNKDYLAGISYVLMMYFGNDVMYFPKDQKLTVYRTVKEHLLAKMTEGQGMRVAPYIRLIFETMFSYNHFEEEDS
jgi:hypothetical protein